VLTAVHADSHSVFHSFDQSGPVTHDFAASSKKRTSGDRVEEVRLLIKYQLNSSNRSVASAGSMIDSARARNLDEELLECSRLHKIIKDFDFHESPD
jgi:hypothetical protein